MHQSIPSANIPRAFPRNFFEVVKCPFQGQNFSAKITALGAPGNAFGRFSKPCLLIMPKIRSTTEIKPYSRLGCFSNYSLVIPSNLSESNIFNFFTVLPISAPPPPPPAPLIHVFTPSFLAEFTWSPLLRSPFTCTHFLLFFVRTLSCRRHDMQ